MSAHQLSLANFDLSNTKSHCDTVHINVPLETAGLVLAVILLQDAASKDSHSVPSPLLPHVMYLSVHRGSGGQLEPLLQVF